LEKYFLKKPVPEISYNTKNFAYYQKRTGNLLMNLTFFLEKYKILDINRVVNIIHLLTENNIYFYGKPKRNYLIKARNPFLK
jgi:hypothetical protein